MLLTIFEDTINEGTLCVELKINGARLKINGER